jgi:hypothetical protein
LQSGILAGQRGAGRIGQLSLMEITPPRNSGK